MSQEDEVKESNPVGRPKIEIDWKLFDNLCAIHCTQAEIAGILGCSVDTVDRRVKETHGMNFAEYFVLKSSTGKVSLRRRQYNAAMEGDKTMLVWLGRNWLGQSDAFQPDLQKDKKEELIIIRSSDESTPVDGN